MELDNQTLVKIKERKEPEWAMNHLKKSLMYESREDRSQGEYINALE